ncbi:uncharacterized protein LY79DRAFT_567006 [Colletotrichum navitas]|uniref:Uncharacterized protein n=1 Tax=Colletotrichum navitas TaxID=681940 RepID=A0AAD8PPK4_9PEZI|nr:uncharacterized protein LY79DRAFT_567006 [Colletotrichum navitas]KAK1574060.1 hypothetical protein LY79DRAFT_567006 [Colletotrichum navitas]
MEHVHETKKICLGLFLPTLLRNIRKEGTYRARTSLLPPQRNHLVKVLPPSTSYSGFPTSAISICVFLKRPATRIDSTRHNNTAAVHIYSHKRNKSTDKLHKTPLQKASREPSNQCVYVGGKAMEGHPRLHRPWVASRQAGPYRVHTKVTGRTL